MADRSNIEWTDATWNWSRGCTRVSPGCDNCYAIIDAHRYPWGEGLTKIRNGKLDWSGEIAFLWNKLREPLRWRKPRHVFVNSGSDTFHHVIPFERIAAAYGVMAAMSGRHIFQVLTKRPGRRLAFHDWIRSQVEEWAGKYAAELKDANHDRVDPSPETIVCVRAAEEEGLIGADLARATEAYDEWPLPNVWEGTSVESRKYLDRTLLLQNTPAALRFLSLEPLLEDLGDIQDYLTPTWWSQDEWSPGIDWVIVGGESGASARMFDIDWARSIRDQCSKHNVAFFMKQLGSRPSYGWYGPGNSGTAYEARCVGGIHSRKGGDPDEWPEDLRVREFPEAKP